MRGYNIAVADELKSRVVRAETIGLIVIAAMLAITDSRFQDELAKLAKEFGAQFAAIADPARRASSTVSRSAASVIPAPAPRPAAPTTSNTSNASAHSAT